MKTNKIKEEIETKANDFWKGWIIIKKGIGGRKKGQLVNSGIKNHFVRGFKEGFIQGSEQTQNQATADFIKTIDKFDWDKAKEEATYYPDDLDKPIYVNMDRIKEESLQTSYGEFAPEMRKLNVTEQNKLMEWINKLDLYVKGKVKVTVKKFGVTFDPGVGMAFSRDRLLLSLDSRIAYLYRFGINVGLGIELGENRSSYPVPYSAVSCALPFKYTQNTAAFVGMSVWKDVYLGLRINF
jgi:hypothetical protein